MSKKIFYQFNSNNQILTDELKRIEAIQSEYTFLTLQRLFIKYKGVMELRRIRERIQGSSNYTAMKASGVG